MRTLQLCYLLIFSVMFVACGDNSQTAPGTTSPQKTPTAEPAKEEVPQSIKEGKGLGEIKNVSLTDPLNEDMSSRGQAIVEMKCASCHKLTDQRVVGPGFAGITNRRRPEWIMNMITNTDAMLDADPEAQRLLEECLTRMPNQNVSIGDARDILEFLRKNDVTQVNSKDEAAT